MKRTTLLLLPFALAALAGCQDRDLPTAVSALRPDAPALQQVGTSTTPGSLVSWGNNLGNQVSATPSGTDFTAVAAGSHHSVALRADGSLVSWGYNFSNQVSGTPSGTFTAVAAGGPHSVALRADGSLVSWGYDDNNEVSATPSYTDFTAVAAGDYHSVALRADGSLVSWGNNGSNRVSATPSGTVFTAVAAGGFHSVAIQAPPAPADETPPVITPSITGTLGTNGWYTSNVTVSWTVVDDESSVSSQMGCEETTISTDTNGQTLTCTATSAGGTDSRSVTIRRDATPPAINLASRLPAANSNGWNNANVTVTWSCTDATSGVVSTSVSQAVSSEGQNQSAPGTCTDQAGNTAQATETGISIDKTPPTLSPSVSPNPVVLNGSATASAGASDNLSGLASQSCEAVNTSTVGSKTVTCTATDNAGNSNSASATYSVAYAFSGFFAPVDNLPTVNVAKAGSAIPVKFSLGGDQGLNIFASGYPRSQAITCDAAAPQGPVEETVTAGSSSLSYDAATDRYTYVWKTEKSWGNTCRTLTLQFTDGSTHTASFKFTK
ncbi:hypothetical protein BH23GEM7_BH23GEM7_29610 [soil metagenome]